MDTTDLRIENTTRETKRTDLEHAFSEVYQILLYTLNSIQMMIPLRFMKLLRENMDSTWRSNVDFSKNLSDMDLLRDTRVLLSLIYRDFLCSPEERKKLIKKDRETAMAEGWEFTDRSLMDMLRSWGY